ncbi:hypothetical protein [Rhodococcus koreensis]|uniref:hypothetical protein n=1 Tax=Rhodococcus koreensis TaxID=99653 RepID=UPI0036D8C4F1
MTDTAVDAAASVQVTEYWVVEVDRHDGACGTFGPFSAEAAWARMEHRTAPTRFAAVVGKR